MPSKRLRPRPVAASQPLRDDAKRSEAALAIWNAAISTDGTLVETYLALRGLRSATTADATSSFRAEAPFRRPLAGDGGACHAWCRRRAAGDPPHISCPRGGLGKAPVDPQKMMLGPCRGGAVRLAPAGDVLSVGEGIETCLAAMQATGHSRLGGAFNFRPACPRSAA